MGTATPLAAALTALGRFPAYATLCLGVLAAGLVRRRWLGRSLTAIGLLLSAEVTSNALKLVFHRPRSTHWLVTHEQSFSYSSGHATNSLVFFGFWAWVALRSSLPRAARIALATALGSVSAAIGWSRLALGAHYPSDVLGGYLLGASLLELGLALVPSRVFGFERPTSQARALETSL